jgi:hypothetical protein
MLLSTEFETAASNQGASMSENHDKFNVFDPTGMMKTMRDAGMDNWAKMMTGLVNSDAYAEANAEMLNAWLSSSAPFRKSMETAVNQSLSVLNLASRDDITRLASRFTNIEMRLDDMEAKLDESLRPKGP